MLRRTDPCRRKAQRRGQPVEVPVREFAQSPQHRAGHWGRQRRRHHRRRIGPIQCSSEARHGRSRTLEDVRVQPAEGLQCAMDRAHPSTDVAQHTGQPDLGPLLAHRCRQRGGLLDSAHERLDRDQFARQPRAQAVRQRAEGSSTPRAIPATDPRSGRPDPRVSAVRGEATAALRVQRADGQPCALPQSAANVVLAGDASRRQTHLHRPPARTAATVAGRPPSSRVDQAPTMPTALGWPVRNRSHRHRPAYRQRPHLPLWRVDRHRRLQRTTPRSTPSPLRQGLPDCSGFHRLRRRINPCR